MSDIISITRPNITSPIPPVQKAESKFPTEIINLPSKGWLYPIESPLSSGTLELKMMTAKEEDILTSRNLIQKNIVLDKLLESVIIDKRIVADDMLIGDRNAAFHAIRRLAYGDEYNSTITCPRCNKENSVIIDLGKMDNMPFDCDKFVKGVNSIEFTLPISGVVVTYKFLSKKDKDLIDAELAALQKISKDFTKERTTQLIHIITGIDGVTEKPAIRKFVNERLVSKDSLALRKHIAENTPNINSEFDFTCVHCGLERKEEMPMGISFFWPA